MDECKRDISDSDPGLLAKMMGLDAEVARVWRPEELAAILRHQLSAPVEFDLPGLGPGAARKLKFLSSAQGLLVKSFADLFHHPHPPVDLLELTKQFAKAHIDRSDSALPREIALVLYYGSIAVALLRCGQRITELDDSSLCNGIKWAIGQPWVDESTRGLFLGAQECLSAEKGQSQ